MMSSYLTGQPQGNPSLKSSVAGALSPVFNPLNMGALGNSYLSGGLLGGGLLGQGLASLFGGGSDPSKEANKYLSQIPGMLPQYFEPYMSGGRYAVPQLQNQLGQLTGNLPGLQQQLSELTSNPGALYGRLGAGYQQSPAYEFEKQQALQGANQAAAAGGMAGSPQSQ